MKKTSLLFLFLTTILSSNCLAETSDLDLIILQNPQAELKKAAKKGQLEKLMRIIRLIDQKKLDLKMFQDPVLVDKAEKREVKNNLNSKKFLFFKGFLWTSLIGIALIPGGGTKDSMGFCDFGSHLDYYPLLLKGLYMGVSLMFLRLMDEGKALWKRDGRLVNQLVKKYHEKSLAH